MDGNSVATWLASLLQIVGINIILSGDNAVVIGLAAHHLPESMRRRAILWGTFAAIILRIVLTGVAFYLLTIDLLQVIGGLLLVWIALKLIWEDNAEGEAMQAAQTIGHAMRIIIIADVVMSLDNVLAVAAAAKSHLDLLIIGLILSMLFIMYGATVIVTLLNRWPWLNSLGAAIIAYVAGEMIVADPFFHKNHWPLITDDWVHLTLPWVMGIGILSYGLWRSRKRLPAQHPTGKN